MQEVRPFRALRYNPAVAGDLGHLIAPPYDVLGEAQKEALRRRSPFNIVHIDCRGGGDGEGSSYAEAGRLLRRWLADGVMAPAEEPAFFLCRHQFSLTASAGPLGIESSVPRRRRELYAAVRLSPWSSLAVLPHEHTRASARGDRRRLLEACDVVLSPVLGVYEDRQGSLASALSEVEQMPAERRVAWDGDLLEVWPLPPHLSGLAAAVLGAGPIVVADGHHRYEAGLAYAETRCGAGCRGDEASHYTVVALVEASDPGLVILPYHRTLRGLGQGLSHLATLLDAAYESEPFGGTLAELMACLDAGSPPRGLALATPVGLTLLRPKPGVDLAERLPDEHSLAWRSLEVSQVQELVLRPLLGGSAEEAEQRGLLAYTHDAAEAVAAVGRGDCEVAILMPPTTMAQVQAVARDIERVPPKSTYFYPKAPAGLLMMSLEGSL